MATVQYARASCTLYAGLMLHVLVRVKGDVRKLDVLPPIQLWGLRRTFTARGWHASSWVSDCYAVLGTVRGSDDCWPTGCPNMPFFGHISNVQAYPR